LPRHWGFPSSRCSERQKPWPQHCSPPIPHPPPPPHRCFGSPTPPMLGCVAPRRDLHPRSPRSPYLWTWRDRPPSGSGVLNLHPSKLTPFCRHVRLPGGSALFFSMNVFLWLFHSSDSTTTFSSDSRGRRHSLFLPSFFCVKFTVHTVIAVRKPPYDFSPQFAPRPSLTTLATSPSPAFLSLSHNASCIVLDTQPEAWLRSVSAMWFVADDPRDFQAWPSFLFPPLSGLVIVTTTWSGSTSLAPCFPSPPARH